MKFIIRLFQNPATKQGEHRTEVYTPIHEDSDPVLTKQFSSIVKFLKKSIHWLILIILSTKALALDNDATSINAALVHKAQDALLAQLNKYPFISVKVEPRTRPFSYNAATATLTPQVHNKYPPLKLACVRLNDAKNSIPVWFKIRAYQKILIAKHDLKSRTQISKNDFMLKKYDVAGFKNKPYTQLPSNAWLKKTIKKNTALTEDYLGPRPHIIKGQLVPVTIFSQQIAINMDAVAQHDAYIGQNIKLKNNQNNKLFTALVSGVNQAEVYA